MSAKSRAARVPRRDGRRPAARNSPRDSRASPPRSKSIAGRPRRAIAVRGTRRGREIQGTPPRDCPRGRPRAGPANDPRVVGGLGDGLGGGRGLGGHLMRLDSAPDLITLAETLSISGGGSAGNRAPRARRVAGPLSNEVPGALLPSEERRVDAGTGHHRRSRTRGGRSRRVRSYRPRRRRVRGGVTRRFGDAFANGVSLPLSRAANHPSRRSRGRNRPSPAGVLSAVPRG